MFVNNGMEVDERGVIQPRPWHDPGPFRHFTRDIHGRRVVVEYPTTSRTPSEEVVLGVTVIGKYARGGVL